MKLCVFLCHGLAASYHLGGTIQKKTKVVQIVLVACKQTSMAESIFQSKGILEVSPLTQTSSKSLCMLFRKVIFLLLLPRQSSCTCITPQNYSHPLLKLGTTLVMDFYFDARKSLQRGNTHTFGLLQKQENSYCNTNVRERFCCCLLNKIPIVPLCGPGSITGLNM